MNLPPIQVSPLIGKTLQLLARIIGACNILEIGTLGGYSAIWMAEALPPAGKLISIEQDPLHCEAARLSFEEAGIQDKIDVIEGDGLTVLNQLMQSNQAFFDMVFLDADKQNYPNYLEPMIALTRPGGLILADNLVRRGKVVSPPENDLQLQTIARFNTLAANHSRLETVILPTLVGYKGGDLDGLSLSRKISI